MELIFHGPRHLGRPPKSDCVPRTRIVTCRTEIAGNAFYKNSRIKPYLKDGRVLCIETVIKSPDDLRCHRRLVHLDELSVIKSAVSPQRVNRDPATANAANALACGDLTPPTPLA